jgi:hypothetical protein
MQLSTFARAAAVAGAAVFSSAGAHALAYTDIFVGSFGTLSWASGGMMWPNYDGGTLHFLSSADKTRVDANRGITYHAAASSSLLDGTLHAEATASRCQRNCHFGGADSNIIGSGTGIWETVHFDSPESMFLLPMRLRIDGIQSGAAHGRVRFYAGYGNPFRHWEQRPSQGWHILGSGTVDRVIDFGDVLVFADSGLKLYVELDTIAYAIGSGPSFADFGNTVHFEWDLPAGVRFTAASGQFMAAAVPEPATWALWLGGAGLVATRVRRRKAQASSSPEAAAPLLASPAP